MKQILLAIAFALLSQPAFAQGRGEVPPGTQEVPGSSGAMEGEPGCSSPGSEGMPDTDAVYLKLVSKAAKSGLKSQLYIGSLIDLGMHYNRAGKSAQACATLTKALAIVDAGALQPTPLSKRVPDKIIEHHGDGTVSAEVVHKPMPYEETLEALFPPLVDSEIATNKFGSAEMHIKRQIKLATTNGVSGQINLMSAYSQYANLCKKMKRTREAAIYQKKADDINATFKGL
ncbi:MAG: hypothetical protein IPG59_17080 [Candidatus Melainabacteria bacterium]|nr:MAG: hypothetical protein IPG59_17080 [Candidatus Melainabacteria bacterium]